MIMPGIKNALAKLPDHPGIYLFYNAADELVYVGKATSLKSRVRSYWSGKRTPRPIEEMIDEVVRLDTRPTDSALEAAILESIAIKKYLPRYNVLGKDDKSWNYLVLTKEDFPRLETIRQHDFAKHEAAGGTTKRYRSVFGPFPGLNSPATLKLLRRMFHYSTCKPGSGRPCLYREIGQCLGVCTGEISKLDYRKKVVQPLALFLSGYKKRVISIFERQMKTASKNQEFETAARLRDQLNQLYRIQDMAILNDSFFKDPELILDGPTSVRVEGYDISNLGASEKVASMVVFKASGPVKSDYRKFIVKTVAGQSDVDSLKEVLGRRLNHAEWPLPTVFLIDGGLPQVHAVQSVFKSRKINVPIIGIAKGRERKRNDLILAVDHVVFNLKPCIFTSREVLIRWVKAHEKLLIAVRDEAHRFAITFHRARRSGALNKSR